MEITKALKEVYQAYEGKKVALSKEEIAYALGRDSVRGKLIGFLTRDYYKRKKLLLEGHAVLGYAFKAYSQNEKAAYSRLWILYSPVAEFSAKPGLYGEIAAKLSDLETDKKADKKTRLFLTALKEPYADAKAMEVPTEYTDGKLVYLYIIDYEKVRYPEMRLGYNFFVSEPLISKELLIMAPRFIPLDVYKEYALGGLIDG